MAIGKTAVCCLILIGAVGWGHAEENSPWQLLETGVDASLRGLCVVDANVIWASGSGSTVLRSSDAGKTWKVVSIPLGNALDFRDIHAFDANNALVLSAGQPARVYQTVDGGKTWTMRFEHANKESFFDALSFWDNMHGIAMSDPVDMRVLLIETKDGGKSWSELELQRRPLALRGEAGFAASGTNMRVNAINSVYIALGGAEEDQTESTSRVVYSKDRGVTWRTAILPIPRSRSSGIFSMAFADAKHGIAVGGDYLNEEKVAGNVAITSDGGKSWNMPKGQPPRGFRSCVAVGKVGPDELWVAVGPTGTDHSTDGGQNWIPTSEIGFHAVQFSPDKSVGFASGSDGRIGKWIGLRRN